MGFSIAIIAFALEDAPSVLNQMDWEVTEVQVGQPVDLTTPIAILVSSEFQEAHNPHFSAATGNKHFFVYVSLSELGTYVNPDYTTMSSIAPLTVHVVVETSNASSIEYWNGGKQIWSVSGASGWEYEISGNAPIDLKVQAEIYRAWWNNLPHDDEFAEPGEYDLPENNDELIIQNFSSLTGDYFAELTGFRYDGDQPALYRLKGEFPTMDTRNKSNK